MKPRSPGSPALAEAPFRRRRQFSPAQVLVLSFTALILAGTILLRLPASAAREPLTVLDALFTATSAVCVTGLIVVDTPNDLTVFGQLVVLALIQLGGLGYMAITTVVGLALGMLLPGTQREDELMGSSRDQLVDRAERTADRVKDAAVEAGRELKETVRTEIEEHKPEVKQVVQEAGQTVKEQVKESARRVKKEAKDAAKETGR